MYKSVSPWDGGQIGFNSEAKTCYIAKVSKFPVEKGYLC